MLRCVIILLLSYSCVTSDLLNLDEGSQCTWKNVPGECVNIHRCLGSIIDSQEKDFAPICSFQGKEPIVCCTDCEFNDTRNVIIDQNLGFLYKTGQKSEDKCLEYIHRLKYACKKSVDFIMERNYNEKENCNEITDYFRSEGVQASYGGVDAYREQFPHMALLGYGDDITSADWLCGGSVISERFILTAGHCLSSPKLGPVRFIALGILKRNDPDELWQKYYVKRTIPHPEYNPPSKYHDIALLETATEITFSNQVLPACLHSRGEAAQILFATGWGALGYRKALADTLQAVYVSRFEEDECSKSYPPHRHLKYGYNHTTQMCYGGKEESKDTCEGDSGGPLQSKSTCTYTVVGVTSFGTTCGISIGSGIYTRVIHYVPWIESIVWP